MSRSVDDLGKSELRNQIIAARRSRSSDQVASTARGFADHVLTLVEQAHADTVAAYVSMADEPPTTTLLDQLHRQGVTVLLPVLLAGLDLDWAVHRPGQLRPGRRGLLEPAGERRGVGAIQLAQLICCPGLAGSVGGQRLGRGGGSYDRALTRAGPAAVRCLLVYDDEVLADIPVEPHDQRVDALLTPTRTLIARTERAGLNLPG